MRARNIKPGFFANDLLVELHPLTRILYAGLWCLADRRGLVEDRPKRIKIEVLPCDDHDVDQALADLADAGLILRFTGSNGSKCIKIKKFLKHQRPHHSEPANPKLVEPGEVALSPGEIASSPGEVASSPALNPESGILNPESGMRNPESNARARVAKRGDKDHDPADIEMADLLGKKLAMLVSHTDPVAAKADADWQAPLLELRAEGRTWKEVEAVMGWALVPGSFWAGRILSAADFRRHYTRARAQWLDKGTPAKKSEEAGFSAETVRPILGNLDYELQEGGYDAAAAWVARQRPELQELLTRHLEALVAKEATA